MPRRTRAQRRATLFFDVVSPASASAANYCHVRQRHLFSLIFAAT